MTPDRIALVLEHLRPGEVAEMFRALALFVRAGIMEPDEAEAWRVAVLARAAEWRAPVAEALTPARPRIR